MWSYATDQASCNDDGVLDGTVSLYVLVGDSMLVPAPTPVGWEGAAHWRLPSAVVASCRLALGAGSVGWSALSQLSVMDASLVTCPCQTRSACP